MPTISGAASLAGLGRAGYAVPVSLGSASLAVGSTSRSFAVSGSSLAGDTLLVVVGGNSTSHATTACTDSSGNVYHLDVDSHSAAPVVQFYRSPGATGGPSGGPTLPLGPSGSLTLTCDSSSFGVYNVAAAAVPAGPLDPTDTLILDFPGTASPASPSFTPAIGGEVLVAGLAVQSGASAVAWSSPTDLLVTQSGSAAWASLGYQAGASTATTLTATFTGTDEWKALVWAFTAPSPEPFTGILPTGAASLSGAGALTALVTEQPAGSSLSGTGVLYVAQDWAALTSDGTAVIAPDVVQPCTAALSGAATLYIAQDWVAVSGTGSVTGTVTLGCTASLAGTGSLTGNATQPCLASLSGTGLLFATRPPGVPYTIFTSGSSLTTSFATGVSTNAGDSIFIMFGASPSPAPAPSDGTANTYVAVPGGNGTNGSWLYAATYAGSPGTPTVKVPAGTSITFSGSAAVAAVAVPGLAPLGPDQSPAQVHATALTVSQTFPAQTVPAEFVIAAANYANKSAVTWTAPLALAVTSLVTGNSVSIASELPTGSASLTLKVSIATSAFLDLNSASFVLEDEGSASLTGTGTLTSLATEEPASASPFTGTGTLTGNATLEIVSELLTSDGTSTIAPLGVIPGSQSLSGAGSLTADAIVLYASTVISGTGVLSPPAVIQDCIAPLSGTGTLSPPKAVQGAVTALSGAGQLPAATGIIITDTDAAIGYDYPPAVEGLAFCVGTGSLSGTALAVFEAGAVLTGGDGTTVLTGTPYVYINTAPVYPRCATSGQGNAFTSFTLPLTGWENSGSGWSGTAPQPGDLVIVFTTVTGSEVLGQTGGTGTWELEAAGELCPNTVRSFSAGSVWRVFDGTETAPTFGWQDSERYAWSAVCFAAGSGPISFGSWASVVIDSSTPVTSDSAGSALAVEGSDASVVAVMAVSSVLGNATVLVTPPAGYGYQVQGDLPGDALDWSITSSASVASPVAGTVAPGPSGFTAAGQGVYAVLFQALVAQRGGATQSATLTGTGKVTAHGRINLSASLSGTGVLSAAVPFQAVTSLSGTGTLSAAETQTPAGAPLTADGTAIIAPAAVQPCAAVLVGGDGTTVLTAEYLLASPIVLAGSGSLTASAGASPLASLAGTGTLTASATNTYPASISGAGFLLASGAIGSPTALSGTGHLSASPIGSAVFGADFCVGTESGISYPTDADSATAADIETPALALVNDDEVGTGDDLETGAFGAQVLEGDGELTATPTFSVTTVAQPVTLEGDGELTATFPQDFPVSDTEACAGTDALAPPVPGAPPAIGVYPAILVETGPGGYMRVTWRGRTVAEGLPSRALLELALHVHRGGGFEFLYERDEASGTDTEAHRRFAQVTVTASAAVPVLVSAGR